MKNTQDSPKAFLENIKNLDILTEDILVKELSNYDDNFINRLFEESLRQDLGYISALIYTARGRLQNIIIEGLEAAMIEGTEKAYLESLPTQTKLAIKSKIIYDCDGKPDELEEKMIDLLNSSIVKDMLLIRSGVNIVTYFHLKSESSKNASVLPRHNVPKLPSENKEGRIIQFKPKDKKE